jgi:hypothetical protein
MKNDDLDKDIRELIADSRLLFGDVEEMDKEELVVPLAESGAPAGAVHRNRPRVQYDHPAQIQIWVFQNSPRRLSKLLP